MQSFKEFVAGRRITVMGLGLLGRGVGDAAFLAECGAQVLVTDKKTETELVESVAQLKKYPNITFHLGRHDENDFVDTDIVIKSAGVPLDSPYIAAARRHGVPVYMSTALFAKYAREAGSLIVGITGTRGKSTVTQMIYEVLQKYQNNVLTVSCECSLKHYSDADASEPLVFLGGNIRGVSTLALLPKIKSGDIVVLELDSWQLQGFGDLQISPNIAVFTNLMPDHQNYYKNMDEYFTDKANIFKFQKKGDVLICGKDVEEKINAARPSVAPLCPPVIPDDWHLQVVGEHNRENASLAAAVLHTLGLPESDIKKGLELFAGIEGRLQFVREVRGVKIYNDNNATTPEATISALRALDTGAKNIVLIMGGADKGLDMSSLLYEIAKHCKRVILLAGTGTTRIAPLMTDYSIFDKLDDAMHEAITSAQSGDIILFSPSFASFEMFKNEYDRNDKFLQIVKLDVI